jgi:putative protease synthase and sporulation negative regulatory protein PAI 2
MMSVKPLLLCLLLASPAAFAGNLSCHESPKSTGNPELDAIVTRYECRYTGSLQQAYSAFMKQGYNGEAPYPKTVPSTLPRKNLTLNGKEKMDCGNTENAQPETFEWSFKLRRKNPNHINMEYQSLDCASGAHTDTEFNRNGKTVNIIHKVYSS